jgi:Uma2 family endonuclease
MGKAHKLDRMSESEYLAFEARQAGKHEYVGGAVCAMVGSRRRHNRIALRLAARLEAVSEGGPCRVYGFDVKLRCDTGPAYYYPDVVVVCDPADDDPLVLMRPCLIAEVPLPSMEAIDRREKDLAYRRLPSLCEYLLLSQDAARIEVHRRAAAGDREAEVLEAGDGLRIECLHLEPSVAETYRGVFD